MLYIIGLGINDEQDLSLKAVDTLKKCDEIYLEKYTGHWKGSMNNLEKIVGKNITVLDREKVESDFLSKQAKEKNIALLVPGDPLAATTHIEFLLEGAEIIHSSSIFTAVGETGLQLYKFGRTASLPKPQEGYKPESFYEIIEENQKNGMHTLILLDTADGGLSVKEAIEILLKIEEKRKGNIIKENRIVACSSLGSKERKIKYGSVEKIMKEDFSKPAVLIIPGKLNFKETEMLEKW